MKRTRTWMLLSILLGATGCAAARADEHEHSCNAIGPPMILSCCKLLDKHNRCTLKGKAQCQPRGCDCGYRCNDDCGGCL